MTEDRDIERGFDPRLLLRVLRRRLWIVALLTLLVPAIALVYSLLAEKEYRATASLLFRDPQLDEKLFGSTFVGESTDEARAAATNLELISLDVVAARTAERVGGGLTPGDVTRSIDTSSEGQADVVTIEASSPDPASAAKLANEFGRQFIAFRRDADREKISSAISLVERQLDELPESAANGADARSLRRRLQELQILASLQTGNAELVQLAEPPSAPAAPRPLRNTVLGLLVGLLLGIAAALVVERFDRRLRDPYDLQDIFDRPLLAIVPATDELAYLDTASEGGVLEPFRLLRANLRYFTADRDVRSVLVTSAQPGDGKTTVAWNLAAASAAAGTPTLLIEADLRRPGLTVQAGRPSPGLSALLSQQASLEEVLEASRALKGDGPRAVRNLDVIFAGTLPPNPDELIESQRMREVLHAAEERYGLVVVDTPPTSVVADAIPLVREVSGVVVIGRLGQTSRDAASQLASQLANLHARVLGIVVNGAPRDDTGYGYYDEPSANGHVGAERLNAVRS